MLVKFKYNWFAPTTSFERDKMNTLSGYLYTAGIHEVPNALKDQLPKSAKIVKKVEEDFEDVPAIDTLKDFETERQNVDASLLAAEAAQAAMIERQKANDAKVEVVIEATPTAAEMLKEKRRANMARARAAKKDKLAQAQKDKAAGAVQING